MPKLDCTSMHVCTPRWRWPRCFPRLRSCNPSTLMAVRALPPCKCNSLIVQIKWCSRRKNGPIPNLSVATGTINQRDYMDEEELARLENAAAAAALQKQWESQDDHTAAQELLPTKCVQRTTDVKLHCKMDYVDFEGRYDGNDLIEILKALRPQKLVIVHADRGSSEFLRMRYSETTRDRIDKSAIFTPTARPPMTIDLTSSRLVRKAKLKDDLFDTVEFYSLGDEYDVGYVDAFVCNNRDPTSANTGNESNADADDAVWLDQPGPPAKRYRGHAVTMIGDIELSKLAVKLKDAELDVEFQHGGVLVCGDDQVMLRKTKTQGGCKIEMEGALCPAYEQIRTILYQEFDFF